jgi:hypothetical protein
MENSRIFGLAIILCAVLAIAGCTGTTSNTPQLTVSIKNDIPKYMLTMSSAPGIGLSPVFEGTAPQKYSCRYTTDYGTFLSWASPDYFVRDLGSNVTVQDPKVYWTFSEKAGSAARPEVHIALDIIDEGTGKIVGHAARTIEWEGDTAVVR